MSSPIFSPISAFEWTVARRYLFTRERKALVSIITLIAMAGVAVGVAALLVVMGVIDGADQLLYGKIADLYPHVRITSPSGEEIRIDEALLARLRQRLGSNLLFAEPIIQKQAIIQAGHGADTQTAGIQIIGQARLGKQSIYKLPDTRTGDSIDIGSREILLGTPLMYQLQAAPDTWVLLSATNPIATALGPILKSTQLHLIGSFSSGFGDFDGRTAFANPEDLRRLFRVKPGYADYIHVKLKYPFSAPSVKAELIRADTADPAIKLKLGRDFAVSTWDEENGEFFGALRQEKLGLSIILTLIILVAAFNIVGTLILMVIEKTREVGILRAMGASEHTISTIFLLDGIIIGLVGTVVGLAIGLTLCLLIPKIQIDLPTAIDMKHIPVEIKLLTVSTIVLGSMAICTLTALYPARQAAKLNPVEALRYD